MEITIHLLLFFNESLTKNEREKYISYLFFIESKKESSSEV